MAADSVLRAGYVFKATTNGDVVVRRMVHLCEAGTQWGRSASMHALLTSLVHAGKFYTFHNYEKDKHDKKTWYLDQKCELSPKSAAEITEPNRKLERRPGACRCRHA